MAFSPSLNSPATSNLLLLLLLTATSIMSFFATPVAAGASLESGQWLRSGRSLENAGYSFTMKEDCSLVLSDSKKKIIWATRTQGMDSGCNLRMQHDGNLVLYNSIGVALWSSQTNKKTGKNYRLILRADHNVVINDGRNNIIWETGTSGQTTTSSATMAARPSFVRPTPH